MSKESLSKTKDRAKGIVARLRYFNIVKNEFEEVLVDFIAGMLPFLTGFLPAYFSYTHLVYVLGVPKWAAFIFAVVIEGYAFANISTYLHLSGYNKALKQDQENARRKTYLKADVKLIVLNLAIYLVVVVLLNGVLSFVKAINGETEVFMGYLLSGDIRNILTLYFDAFIQSFVVLLASALTIPGAITVMTRTEHKRYLESKKTVRKKKAEPLPNEDTRNQDKPEPQSLSDKASDLLSLLDGKFEALENKTAFAKNIGWSRPTLNKYLNELVERGYVK
jgi:ABC-type multidrug transport system fused ATPase/permease subunit